MIVNKYPVVCAFIILICSTTQVTSVKKSLMERCSAYQKFIIIHGDVNETRSWKLALQLVRDVKICHSSLTCHVEQRSINNLGYIPHHDQISRFCEVLIWFDSHVVTLKNKHLLSTFRYTIATILNFFKCTSGFNNCKSDDLWLIKRNTFTPWTKGGIYTCKTRKTCLLFVYYNYIIPIFITFVESQVFVIFSER